MNLIALEASTCRLSVALWLNGEILQRGEDVPNGGSERMLPWIREMLADAGVDWQSLDGIAFGAGPGAFTGLRLACALSQGLAFGLDLPVVGVSSLEALATAAHSNTDHAEPIFACLDARMGEIYVAGYRVDGESTETVLAPSVVHPKELRIPAAFDANAWVGCGDGFDSYSALLDHQVGTVRRGLWPTAAAVARLAAPRLARGEGGDLGEAVPLYVRDKVALTTTERLARGGLK